MWVPHDAAVYNPAFDVTPAELITGIITEKEYKEVDPASYPGCTIHPPVFIGDNVTLINTEIGPKVSVEHDTVIRNSKISNSIIRDHAQINDTETEGSTIGAYTSVKGLKGQIDIGDHSSIDI